MDDPGKHPDEEQGLQSDSLSDTLMWSLAHLPDVILVRVMEYLSLKEKYYLSITCQRFYDLFKHPDLWKTVRIHLLQKGAKHSRWQSQAVMPKTMSEIVKRFAHLFQHLSLQMSCIIQPFDESVVKLLKDLSHECRLESLSLEVGLLESSDHEIQMSRNSLSNLKDIHLVTELLQNAVRLKHLKIVSWPLHANSLENDIFQAILNNGKLKSLQSLSLFFIDVKQQWTGRVPRLPTTEKISEVVSFFPNLTDMSLRSPMINDEVIMKLASEKRKRIEHLKVLIIWSRANASHGGYKIPVIKDQSWHQLKKSSPSLKVEFFIHVRIPFDELADILKTEVPLSSLTILRYGQCQSDLIESLASKYGLTLNSFISLCDSDNCDAALMNLLKECKNLNHLQYHGSINYRTVMEMATYLKDTKRELKVFEFKEQNIKTDELLPQEVDDDSDVVILKNNETDEYVIAGIQSWNYDEEKHRKKLDHMAEHLSNTLGALTDWCLL